MKCELHVQACTWHNHAVLVLEGEAPNKKTGSMIPEAAYQVALARGLRLATDLDHLDLRPVPAWRVRLDEHRRVTLDWPHRGPLFDRAPLDLPAPWLPTAMADGVVLIFAGYGLGMCEHANDGESHPLQRLEAAAYNGALAAGAATLTAASAEEVQDFRVVIPTQRRPIRAATTKAAALTTAMVRRRRSRSTAGTQVTTPSLTT